MLLDYWLTDKGRGTLAQIKRTTDEILESTKCIEDQLMTVYRRLNTMGAMGETVIIKMPERQIGKTTALLNVSADLGLHIITQKRYAQEMKYLASERLGVVDHILVLEDLERTYWDGRRLLLHTVLVDETTDVARVRKLLDKPMFGGVAIQANIIAIQ